MAAERRLLVVSHGFPPYYGGAEHAAGHLARAAAASGRWRVQVLTSDIGGRLPAREAWDGCDVLRVKTRKKEWTNHTVPELLSFLLAAGRAQGLDKPDWMLAHFTLPGGEAARRWAQRWGVPYAVVLHGADVPDSQKGRYGAVYPLVKPLARRVWRQADRVLAVSGTLRDLALKTWPEGAIDVVPNGVDVERFQPPVEGRPARADGTVRLVAAARLFEVKGLHILIDALAKLPDDLCGRIRLELCGAGPYESELRRRVRAAGLENQMTFAGLVAYDDIPGKLHGADVFVLPSLQEGLPLSLLEAMASGLPVAASTVGGIPDVVQDGVNGLLAPAGDAWALADVLAQLAGDADLRSRLGAAACRDALPWSWAAVWERYEALLAP